MSLNNSLLTVSIEDVIFHAFHGVFPQEAIVGNEFSLSLSVKIRITEGMKLDMLEGTVSYADLYDICLGEMSKPSKLIEHLAIRIVHKIKLEFPEVVEGEIRITKLHPPIAGFDGKASVCMRF